jgi:hypothetical protein
LKIVHILKIETEAGEGLISCLGLLFPEWEIQIFQRARAWPREPVPRSSDSGNRKGRIREYE